jgi:hypothetical protein
MSRRIATDADLTTGTIVFKSEKAPTAWKVANVTAMVAAPGHPDNGRPAYTICKAENAARPGGAIYAAVNLWIEA